MTNQHNIFNTLQHRLATFHTLAENPTKHAYLLPELLLKTIRDTHRMINGNISYKNCVEILDILEIPTDPNEKNTLTALENSLRKAKDYAQLAQTYDVRILINIASSLETKILSLEQRR